MVRCTKGLKGIKGAGALILALSLTFVYPAVSWAVETEASEGAVTYGPGSYVVGEDILPGEYAVFTEDTSEQNAYSTCTITLYKDDTDERRIGTFQFQHHGLITLYKGQHLVRVCGGGGPGGHHPGNHRYVQGWPGYGTGHIPHHAPYLWQRVLRPL